MLIEVGLRIAGFIHKKRATFDQISLNSDKENYYTILCLGDSFSVGVGALQENSYPRQLERLINSKAKGKMVKVINGAIGGYNTRQVLNKL